MFWPSPLAHHSLVWKPLPENSAAKRTGASLAGAAGLGSSPQTGSDSSQGRAIVTPTPRRNVRRENRCIFILNTPRSGISIVLAADLAELPAAENRLHGREKAVVVLLQLLLHLFKQRLVGKLYGAA